MINDLKPYPAMKDSGVPWLGEVPEHWSIARSKRLFRQRKEFARPEDQQLSATQAYGVIPQAIYESRTGYKVVKISLHLEKRRHVEADDFVISMRSFEGGLERAWSPGAIRSSYVVLKPSNEAHPGFFQHLFKSAPYIAALRGTADFIRDGQDLNFDNFCDVALPLIPPQEQAAIVRFLNHADRKISRYIRAKQKLIKLLEEQKQAIIHRAVTRGLDPDVRLKPSGVEWLGDVPEHWEVARASSVCSFRSAKAHEQFVEPDGEHICVTARFVSTNGQSFRRCTKNLSPARRGDVLMVMSDLPRGRALARSFLVKDDQSYAVNQRVCILRPTKAHPAFLAFVANRHPELLAHDDGFNQTHLPGSAFKIMRLPLPPLEEQISIADYLIRVGAVIEDGKSRATSEIELLGEYRTRLIADVVTGKLDVRAAAAKLTSEDQENPPIDEWDDISDAEEAGLEDFNDALEEPEP